MGKSKPVAVQDMDDDTLMAEWTSLGEEYAAMKERLREFSAEHDQRNMQKQLADRLGALSDPERAALTQYVEAQAAESQEAVGNVGEGEA